MQNNLPLQTLRHRFVELIPDDLEEGVLYISMEYATAVHNCACGCGNPVISPFSRTDWKFSFDGESISLYPSIGNWNFSCRSHYFITNSRIHHCRKWNEKEIEAGWDLDKNQKKSFFKWRKRKNKKR